ncbi:MAG: aspartate aminotransferase family protein [Acidobacteria bacterium]|nr:aspartate aminotransferase family protein [Acidobacteriota bacterium]
MISEVGLAERSCQVDTYLNRRLELVRGEGVYLYTAAGERYLDMMSNYGVNILGYGHPAVTRALTAQISHLPALHCSFNNDVRAAASRALIDRLGGSYRRLYWSNSGAEAIEAALKFAVLATGRKRFIACRDGYHGKTLGALSATHGSKYRAAFEPLLWEFCHIDFGSAEALESAIDDETAAFLVEPIQGESGVLIPDATYLRAVREICDRTGVLLILDEIQTGAGRTGTFLASRHSGVDGDIVCLGKGIAGGVPIGITATTAEVADRIGRSAHTSTFGGNPLACAGVLAVLGVLDDSFLAEVAAKGRVFMERLSELDSPLVKAVRGSGLMIGVEVFSKRNEILQSLQRARILTIPAGENVVRFLPPYVIDEAHLESVVETLNRTSPWRR